MYKRQSQIVFVGRSNVGKSSLINALIRRKLARTSRSPGKTDLVNIYRVRLAVTANQIQTIDFVDLPGYGYARGGTRRAESFAKITEHYFKAAREPSVADDSAMLALHLVDSRHSITSGWRPAIQRTQRHPRRGREQAVSYTQLRAHETRDALV